MEGSNGQPPGTPCSSCGQAMGPPGEARCTACAIRSPKRDLPGYISSGSVCPRCHETGGVAPHGYCPRHQAMWQRDRRISMMWAGWIFQSRTALILDTETTGLDGAAEVVELSLLTMGGDAMFDSLLRPSQPIPTEATAIHGVGDATVASAPTFPDLYHQIALLVHGRTLIVYNAAYDRRILDQTCARYRLPSLRPGAWHCAMVRYAAYVGQWNRLRSTYCWHKLGGGDHSALGDCRATRELMTRMAEVA